MGGSQLGRDQELSRALYEEHATALVAYVRRLVHGDQQLAEDIVQETMLRAWRRAGQVPARARRPWLFITARHLVVDAYRARNARPTEVSADLMDGAVEDDELDVTLDALLLTDALRSLTPEHRAVIHDAYYRGQTAVQIASARGIPSGTVRSRIHYALRALRLALQERGVNGP